MQDAQFDTFPATEKPAPERRIWTRGLVMLAFVIMFAIAESLLAVLALVQFLWMLLTGDRNRALTDFGAALGRWMSQVASFQAAETEERPFPWAPWPSQ